MKQFPDIISQNLNSAKGRFPGDFTARWNILLVGFLMEHQRNMESWLPYVQQWEETLDSCKYYEMPVLPPFDFTSRASIFLSMRWYIGDVDRRERTFATYTDIRDFLRATGTSSQVQSRIMLVDSAGAIHINAPGSASDNLVELFNRKFGLISQDIWTPGKSSSGR